MPPDELSIIDRYFRPLAGEGAFALRDDAALLAVPLDCDLVVTTDMVVEGVHFLVGDPADTIAQKALRVNLSDLAAKGATPLAYTLSIGLGPRADEQWLAGFSAGLKRDQELFTIALLGGDTVSSPGGTVVSVTAFGCAPKGRMVHRFGGRPGDALYVSGIVGAGAAGLALLRGEVGGWGDLSAARQRALETRYRVPEPRVALAPVIAEFTSAAMDVSDGLVGDCDKLARASGCRAFIKAERVPLPEGLSVADDELLARLITGGDDFEILAAVPPEKQSAFATAAGRAGVQVTRIGSLTYGEGPTDVTFRGAPLPLKQRAYVHGSGGER